MDVALAAIEADAREFGLHDRQGPWRLGLLVARSVAPSKGQGSRTDTFSHEKVSASEFAHLAGTSTKRVRNYFRAWEKAAKEGHVPHAAELSPGQEMNTLLWDRLPEWSDFYVANPPPSRVDTRIPPLMSAPSDYDEPPSETMAWNSAACSIPTASERIDNVKGSLGALLAGKVYKLNTSDLERLETILLEALEKVAQYEPLKSRKSRTVA